MPVRPATLADADAIARLEAGEGSAWGRAAIELMLERGDDTVCCVACVDDVVVGYVLATAIVDEGEILMVRVAPEAQRRGLGRALMDAATATWRARGVTTGWLEVHVDNAAARALYGRLGWTEHGRRSAYYADGGDALILRLDC